MRRSSIRVAVIMVSLAFAAFGPRLYAGWQNIRLAEQAAAAGRYADASRCFEKAARLLPWRVDLWEPAGLAAFQAGDNAGAVRLLSLAAHHTRLSLDALVALGSSQWMQGDPSGAIAAWKSGLIGHPDEPALLDRLVAAYDHQGDFTAEQGALEMRLAAGEDAASSYRLGLLLMADDPDRAQVEIQTAAALDPQYESVATTLSATLQAARVEPDASRRLVLIGRGLGLAAEWRLASQAFEKATVADANNAEAWAWLGEAQQQRGHDGRHALDEALRLGNQDPLVHGLRALYWRRQSNYPAALAEQLQATRLQPNNAALQSGLADAYASAGDLVSALSAYQDATTLAPQDAGTWRQLASFCADNGVQVKEVGLPAAVKASTLAPNDPETLDVLGWSYAQAGLLETAKQTLLQAVKANPDLASGHLHLAETYIRLGDYVNASGELRQTADLDPNGSSGQLATQLLNQYFP